MRKRKIRAKLEAAEFDLALARNRIEELEERIGDLKIQVSSTPTYYFAALAGIVQGQKHPDAGPGERAERARAIDKWMNTLIMRPNCGKSPLVKTIDEYADKNANENTEPSGEDVDIRPIGE